MELNRFLDDLLIYVQVPHEETAYLPKLKLTAEIVAGVVEDGIPETFLQFLELKIVVEMAVVPMTLLAVDQILHIDEQRIDVIKLVLKKVPQETKNVKAEGGTQGHFDDPFFLDDLEKTLLMKIAQWADLVFDQKEVGLDPETEHAADNRVVNRKDVLEVLLESELAADLPVVLDFVRLEDVLWVLDYLLDRLDQVLRVLLELVPDVGPDLPQHREIVPRAAGVLDVPAELILSVSLDSLIDYRVPQSLDVELGLQLDVAVGPLIIIGNGVHWESLAENQEKQKKTQEIRS